MKTPHAELFPVFRSAQQAAILSAVHLAPGEHSPASIADLAGVTRAAVSKVLGPLVRAEVLAVRVVGRRRLYRANEDAPFHLALHTLLEITHGPPHVLAETLAGVPGIDEAHLVGPWAARARQLVGPAPSVIDLIIVGNPPETALTTAVHAAVARLHRPVEVTVVSPAAWKSDDAAIRTLRDSPRVTVPHERPDPTGLDTARPVIERLLAAGSLTTCPPDADLAHTLLTQAADTLGAAARLTDEFPSASVELAHESVHRSLTGFLHARGLRPTPAPGERTTVIEAVTAQLRTALGDLCTQVEDIHALRDAVTDPAARRTATTTEATDVHTRATAIHQAFTTIVSSGTVPAWV